MEIKRINSKVIRVSFNKKIYKECELASLAKYQDGFFYNLEDAKHNIHLFFSFKGKDKGFEEVERYVKALIFKICTDAILVECQKKLLEKMQEE